MRWVDRIARLGRLGTTVDKVEHAARQALRRRRLDPHLGGVPAVGRPSGKPVYASRIGYVQHVDTPALQACAEAQSLRITVAALPGTFASPGRPLAHIAATGSEAAEIDSAQIARAFEIGAARVYEDDPRFGLIALSEIAARALSPAVNDPGTAIEIIGSFVRLLVEWSEPLGRDDMPEAPCPLVCVPELSTRDLFDDAFTAIARDGAATIEVQMRLQKAFCALGALEGDVLRRVARDHSRSALARAKRALTLPDDFERVNRAALWSQSDV